MQAELSSFIARAKGICAEDTRIVALLACGSIASGAADRYSDIDLVVVCGNDAYDGIMHSRESFAAKLGILLSSFTGEHVGEPRLLICLYDDPILHVDLKFIAEDDLGHGVEKPLVLFSRCKSIAQIVESGVYEWPSRNSEWFEARFWIWMHYCAGKIARGELFEAHGMLAFAREHVIGPMIARSKGLRERGVRRIESESPEWAAKLARTIPTCDKSGTIDAMLATIEFYKELRKDIAPQQADDKTARAVIKFIKTECG